MLLWALQYRLTGKIIYFIPFKVKGSKQFHMKVQGDGRKKKGS